MSKYAVMPLIDYADTCGAIRARITDQSIIKSSEMPMKITEVYANGRDEGYNQGWDIGYGSGFDEGISRSDARYEEGIEQGKSEVYSEIEPINAQLENTLNGTDTGGKSYYDEFWDAYQPTTYVYPYQFSSKAWNDNNFYPKRDMIGTANIYGAFYAIGVTDLVKRLNDCGVKLDTSKATRFGMLFSYAYELTTIPKISTISAPQFSMEFFECLKLKTIECLEFHENLTYDNVFVLCNELENLTIEGVIGQNGFDVHWSTKLSKASIISIINALSTTASGKSVTLSNVAVESAFGSTESEEWISLINARSNWTINLV